MDSYGQDGQGQEHANQPNQKGQLAVLDRSMLIAEYELECIPRTLSPFNNARQTLGAVFRKKTWLS
jgi:hypothetical protein